MSEAVKHPTRRPDQVILRPLVTEKGVHQQTRRNVYAFEVAKEATKTEIRSAVETLFNVKVLRVHTQTRKGKPRRTRLRMSQTNDWKRALVKLHEDNRIELF